MNTLDLSGEWQLRWYDGQRGQNRVSAVNAESDPALYMPAQVPGEIHWDLMRAGILNDTNDGANVLAARWVEEFFWTYRLEFDAPESTGDRAWLVFDRLFLHVQIVLNGQEVGRHGNAFRPCRIDVTGKVVPGKNVLVVHIESGLYWSADKATKEYAFHDDTLLHRRSWLRAPQCSFGWDWAPRLINVGISGGVRLEWTDAPVRLEAFVPLATLESDLQSGRVCAKVFLDASCHGSGTIEVAIPELGLSKEVAVDFVPGESVFSVELEAPAPELWQPIGRGKAKRYTVVATVRTNGHEIVESSKVGFRHVVWDQSAHPVVGRYFRLIVNGVPVFCKGANFVPADTIFARIDASRYEKLVQLAIEANFNFLRVWGGGLYEAEEFYELCDEHGILVWQEFIYACAKYPMIDEAFHEEAKQEARYQVRRLACRPSLVAWCGNNEMEEGNWHWKFDKGIVYPDYAFFHLTLPRIMAEEDPTRYYQPSSPFSPDRLDPHDDHVGDQHPWSVSFFDTDVRKYRVMECRFPNEGGVMGPTTLPTLERCLQSQSIGHFNWKVHDNSIATWREPSVIDGVTQRTFGKDFHKMSPAEYIYWGGLVQCEGLKEYIENFRRRMFDSACAIFWMFNDTWPAARSWTIVDYDLRRVPSFSAVKRAMQPVHVVLAEEGDEVKVYGINDTLEPVSGELRFGLMDLSGGDDAETASVSLPPNASVRVGSFPRSKWSQPTRQLAFAELATESGSVRNRLVLPLWPVLEWGQPEVHVTARPDGGHELTSATFLPGLCLDLESEPEFHDLFPGVPVVVRAGQTAHIGRFGGDSVELIRLV